MPKIKESTESFLKRVTAQFSGILRCDDSVLFCLFCNTTITGRRMFNVTQHFGSSKHIAAAKRRENQKEREQTLVTEFKERETNPFNIDICKTFIEANIPLKKIRDPSVVKFLQKYTKYNVPGESTLRRYVPTLYKECIENLQAKVLNKYIWVSLDETTDAEHLYIANFVFGIMNSEDENNKCYLLNVAELNSTNASTIAAFFNDSLCMLWPGGIQYSNILIVVTDAAAYMRKVMSSLKILYPKMLHITCFAHALHRLAEFVRLQFNNVNTLIATNKSIFLKAPSRKKKLMEMFPDLSLPPSPVITRWGTWLQAAEYYCNNFTKIKTTVYEFDEEDSEAIKISKKLFMDAQLKSDLVYIKTNFICIVDSIIQLEKRGIPLNESIAIMDSIRENLQQLENKIYFNKFISIMSRNTDFNSLVSLKNVLFQNSNITHSIDKFTPEEITKFKYSPVTSCDVERTFSVYGNILTEQRRNFTVENIKMHMVVHCNK